MKDSNFQQLGSRPSALPIELITEFWRPRLDSNERPSDLESEILPLNYTTA